jgi:hypothetical protein|tara:strand:- start:366 stop:743 length:378 start_codon:yes stop_codon:yes gene_type:complete
MAVSANLVLDGTHTAQVDLSAWQFLPVKIGTTGTVDKADATADIPFGILQNDPAAGESAIVATSGRSKVYAGETLVIGEIVTLKVTSGRVITAAAASYPIGTVTEIAGDGQVGSIQINISNTVKA